MDLNINFTKFLQIARSPERINFNSWIKYPGFNGLYLRYGARLIKGKKFNPVLDIANVEVKNPGNGTFKRFIKTLQEFHPELNIYVESVLSKLFGDGLVRMGFIRLDNPSMPDVRNNYFMAAIDNRKD